MLQVTPPPPVWPQTILVPQRQMVQMGVMGLWPTSAGQNFWIWRNLDPGVSAWVELAPLLAETCSTPGFGHAIRPRQKRLGRIPGLEHGIDQFSAMSKACSTQAEMPRSTRNLLWLNSA